MKPVISFVVIAFGLFLLTGFGSRPVALTQEDSAAVAGDYVKRHPEMLTGAGADGLLTGAGAGAFSIVSKDSLENMRAAYMARPLAVADTNGQAITGFVLPAADFADIKNSFSKLKTIGFHFGIQNFNYAQNGQKPIYTLVVIPVGTNGQPYPQTEAAAPNVQYGYDFVDPCPGGLGCPPPPGK